MAQHSSDKHAEFLKRYSILIDDIKYLKSRQWTITYYLLLLYAAIIGFYKLMGFDKPMGFDKGSDVCFEKTILSILILMIATFGTIYQWLFQSRISRYRTLLKATFPHLSDSFRKFEIDALKERFGNENGYTSWWNGFWLFTFPFIMIFWISAGLIIWYFFNT